MNLIEPDPLRRVKLRLSSEKLAQLHPADLADIMEELSPDERQSIIGSLDEETAAETIAELDKRLQTQVVEKLDPGTAADIIEEMSPDEAADLIQSLEPETSKEVLEEMEHREAHEVESLLRLRREHRRRHDEHGNRRRRRGRHARRSGRLHSLPRAFARPARQRRPDQSRGRAWPAPSRSRACCSPMPTSAWPSWPSSRCFSVKPDAHDKDVFEIFDKYNLRSLTVVDGASRPIGAITVDDVVSRMRAKI